MTRDFPTNIFSEEIRKQIIRAYQGSISCSKYYFNSAYALVHGNKDKSVYERDNRNKMIFSDLMIVGNLYDKYSVCMAEIAHIEGIPEEELTKDIEIYKYITNNNALINLANEIYRLADEAERVKGEKDWFINDIEYFAIEAVDAIKEMKI